MIFLKHPSKKRQSLYLNYSKLNKVHIHKIRSICLSKYLLLVVSTSVLLTSLLLILYISNIQALPVRDGKEMSFFNASNAIYEGNGEKLLNNKIYH